MEHSTIEQTGDETGEVGDLVCFQGNKAGWTPHFSTTNSTDGWFHV